MTIDPGLAFILGWASCVLFIAAWEYAQDWIDRHDLTDDEIVHHGDPCPWDVKP